MNDDDISDADWAEAIATRISDEWDGRQDFPEDARLLQKVLKECFVKNPDAMEKLIGTGIIEETYFDPLD